MATEQFYGTGRRKSAIARVFLVKGTGKVKVNGKELQEYLAGSELLAKQVLQPLEIIQVTKKYDIMATATGGGVVGQAGALTLGVARALLEVDVANRPALKVEGLLTRDPREKERKKYGRKKARKRFQFSKR
jgi:small subunit ribosomal protein S9